MQQFLARVVRLDRVATRFDESGGYDDDFREPVLVSSPLRDNVGELARRELEPILIPCQVEPQVEGDGMRMLSGGQSPIERLTLVFHFRDLERLGLVVDGNATLRHGDRLDAILSRDGARTEYSIPNPPGLYLVSSSPRGWGIFMSSPRRNLLMVEFADRRRATQRFE
jgi:hypothetical protein